MLLETTNSQRFGSGFARNRDTFDRGIRLGRVAAFRGDMVLVGGVGVCA